MTKQKLNEIAHFTHIRPILEYACPVWDSVQKELIHKLEKVRNCAVRYIVGEVQPHKKLHFHEK